MEKGIKKGLSIIYHCNVFEVNTAIGTHWRLPDRDIVITGLLPLMAPPAQGT